MSGRRLDSRAQLQTCSIAYIIWIITVAIIRVTGVRELTTEHNPTSSKPSWFLWLSWLSSGWLGWGTWRQGTTQHHHNYLIVIIQIIIIVIVITAMLNNRVTGVRDLTTGHDSTQPDNKAVLPVSSSSQMVSFVITLVENYFPGTVLIFRSLFGSSAMMRVLWHSPSEQVALSQR